MFLTKFFDKSVYQNHLKNKLREKDLKANCYKNTTKH